jgi:hypothetical protein
MEAASLKESPMTQQNISTTGAGGAVGSLCASAPAGAAKRVCPVVLAALASLAVAYGFGLHPLLQFSNGLPLSDMAPGLAQAFTQLGNLPLPGLTRHAPATHAIG